jgi:hypothetical protein
VTIPIKKSIQEIAGFLGGLTEGPNDAIITGVAGISKPLQMMLLLLMI